MRLGKTRLPCGTKPTPLREIASGAKREIDSPDNRISPLRERHRDFNPSLFTVGDLCNGQRRALLEADQSQDPARFFV